MSKHLINESPLTVQPTLAKLVGLERAIILQQVHYATNQPRSGKILDDGKKYVWNTYSEWQKNYFTFWSKSNIQKHFLKLEKLGYLISCQPNLSEGDATKYYRVNSEKIDAEIAKLPIVDQSKPSPSTRVNHPHRLESTIPIDQSKPSLKGTKTSSKTSNKEYIAPSEKCVSDGTQEKIDSYVEKLLTIYNAVMLPNPHRWLSVIKNAIENKIPSEMLANRLRQRLANKSPNYNVTPESVLNDCIEHNAIKSLDKPQQKRQLSPDEIKEKEIDDALMSFYLRPQKPTKGVENVNH